MEGGVGAVFIYCLYCTSGKSKREVFFKLRDIDTLFLKVGIFTDHTCGIEFGSTNTVGVASSHF